MHRKRTLCKVCKSKVVAAIEQQGDDSDSSEVFLGAVSAPKEFDLKKMVYICIEVCGTQIKFKMDTGVDETCIPESVYEELKKKPKLCKPKKRLHSCNSKKLNICGMFTVALTGKRKVCSSRYLCCKGLTSATAWRSSTRSFGLD